MTPLPLPSVTQDSSISSTINQTTRRVAQMSITLIYEQKLYFTTPSLPP